MKIYFLTISLCLIAICCKRTIDKPKSKTDYIPINSAITPRTVAQGQMIVCRVNCGFYEHFADIRFLNFQIKKGLQEEYEIRALGHYENISYGASLPVVSTFDTTLTLPASATGPYILKFYRFNKLIQTDTVRIN